MIRAKILKSGQISEETIHKIVMDWVRLNPEIKRLIFHIPNEGRRSQGYGRLLRDLGMRRGVSDLFIAMPRRNYHGAWIELKSANGKLSEDQALFQLDMAQQNYFVTVCWAVEEAIETIKWYCFG